MAMEKKMMEKEEKEDGDEKKKKSKKESESECVARFEEMLKRFAYNKPPPTPRPRVRVWSTVRRLQSSPPSDSAHKEKENTQKPPALAPIHSIPDPLSQNDTGKKMIKENIAVRVVSPYFQVSSEHNYEKTTTTKRENKEKTKKKKRAVKFVVDDGTVRVVSPYFLKNREEHEYHNKVKKKKKKKRIMDNDVRSLKQQVPIVVSPYFAKEEHDYHINNNSSSSKVKKKKKRIMDNDRLSLKQETPIFVSPYFAKEEPDEENKRRRKKKKKDISNSSDHRVVSPYFLKDKDKDQDQIVKVVSKPIDEQPKQKKKRARTTDDEKEGCDFDCDAKPKPIKKTRTRKTRKSVMLTAAEKKKDAYRRRDESNTWVPPRSHHGLLQEFHYQDPWRVLLICILLNITSGTQVKRVIDDFFEEYPNARAAAEADEDRMKEIIQSLGLKNKRTEIIKRMSKEYLEDNWTHVTQLYGVGKYAADAYAIFCTGKWNQVSPHDHKLEEYYNFMDRVADGLNVPLPLSL